MKTGLNLLFYSFLIACLVFIGFGLYSLDIALISISISILFAVAALLIGLENKQYLRNPFRH